ncbi:MFS transporter [Paenibacillaceae bacterium WGS1546]|uniref:MFS transporter n=1 Tax=Cohnella sp. WGS1546 TaxID=3366810 RepID=UPI00372D5B93
MFPPVAETRAASRARYGAVTFVLVWCAVAVVSSLYVALPMIDFFAERFQASAELAAWTSSGFSLTYAFGFLLAAPLSERYGTWPVMLAGLIGLAVVTPLIGLMDSLPGVVAMRAAQGLTAATFAPNALTYIAEVYPAERRVSVIGFVSAGFLLAGIVGQAFGVLVLRTMGWPAGFLLLGAVYSLSALLLGLMSPRAGRREATGGYWDVYRQIGRLFRNRALLFCYAVALTLFLTFIGMYAALGSLLSAPPFSLDDGQILLVRAAGIFGMLLSPFTGKLAARFGLPAMLKSGLLLAISGMTALCAAPGLAVLAPASIVFVAGISVMIPTLVALTGQIADRTRGAAMTLYSFILFVGATLGPLVSLSLMQAGGQLLAFAALALLLVGAFACAAFLSASGR